ncbi:MAG: mannitol dehydrogenase family protein [Bacteroidales bacterium]
MEFMHLSNTLLDRLPASVAGPRYDRSRVRTGIVHVGVGNFHRSHQAWYTQQLLNLGHLDWGICGICLLEGDREFHRRLKAQDGLYTLVRKESDGSEGVEVIGSLVDCLFAPDDPAAVIAALAAPEAKIVSLTVTEGGYNMDSATGEFLFEAPGISRDLAHPDDPRTLFGYLTAALGRRMDEGRPGLTIQSCDNLVHNGDVCRTMLLSYVEKARPELAEWIRSEVTFPNSMVDRITPAAPPSTGPDLEAAHGIRDLCPVVAEPFSQWIIEDRFSRGRPPWEVAGAQFVSRVDPYEHMKIGLLNAGHSLLGFSGSLLGYQTIDEAVADPRLAAFLRAFMEEEVTPQLGEVEGIDLNEYKDTLLHRFANPFMGDRLSRICSESSAKIPKFLLPTLRGQVEGNGSFHRSAWVLAAWCRYLDLAEREGREDQIQDQMRAGLLEAARRSREVPRAFLELTPVFGDLARFPPVVAAFEQSLRNLRQRGVWDSLSLANGNKEENRP